MKKIVIVTGGSGGHVVPSISLFEHLKDNFNVEIVTDLRGSKFIDKNKLNYSIIDVPNLFLNIYLFPIKIFKYFLTILNSINYIKKNNISIIISTGGYMSLPFCVAANLLKKKIFLFEPNSVLGRSNKLILKFSTKIICYDTDLKNFPTKYRKKKVVLSPILKKQIYEVHKNSLDKPKNIKKILVIGGSQGASFFDTAITELIVEISKSQKIEIVQQISKNENIYFIKKKYDKENIKHKFFKFTNDINEIYADIDLAITRGGANTLSELSFLRIPYISIPLPSARDNHQYHNSNYYYKKNCCWLIDQNKFQINDVFNLVFKIFNNDNEYKEKLNNLEIISKKNTWNNINNNIMEIINEN